ncbi:hypothetical protein RYX36_020279 [Vicia faba]
MRLRSSLKRSTRTFPRTSRRFCGFSLGSLFVSDKLFKVKASYKLLAKSSAPKPAKKSDASKLKAKPAAKPKPVGKTKPAAKAKPAAITEN